MVRYGVSATPTYALIDQKGAAPFYSPTRLSEFELSRRIEAVFGIDSLIPIISGGFHDQPQTSPT
jgi:hypothetical protein